MFGNTISSYPNLDDSEGNSDDKEQEEEFTKLLKNLFIITV